MGDSVRINRKSILAVLIISMFLFQVTQIYSLNPAGSLPGNQSGDSSELQPNLPNVANAPGPSRPIVEYALGTRAGQTVTLPGSPNAYVDLGSGWVGKSATMDVVNLWDSRDHAVNGSFTSGSGTSSPPWSFSKYDPLSHSTFSGTWVQNSPQSGNRTVQCQMPLPSSSITFNGNERVSWNETILPLRGTVLSARLVFNWWPVVASGFTRSEFVFYATVNNTRLVGVGSPFPWQVNLKDVASNSSMNGHWNLANFTLPTSAFDLPSKRISIQIGIMYTSGSATYTGWNTQNIMYIDNVKLILQAYAKPSQISLNVKPQGFSDTTVSDGSGYGTGQAKMTGFTTSGTSFPFIFSSSIAPPNAAGFSCTAKVNATRQSTATSSFQGQGPGQKVAWSFSYRTYFSSDSQPVGSGPTVYTKYYFNLSVPSDYSFTTCLDPDLTSHNINTDLNFTKFTVASNLILRVNVSGVRSYTSASNPPPAFNPYEIGALSNNYVSKMWTQLQTGPTWTNKTSFYPKETMKVVAYINGSSPMSSGVANLTIRGPPVYNASSTIIETLTGVTPVSGWANFTKTIPVTYAAGNYSAQVDWVDSAIGEAGSLSCKFNVTHTFRVSVVIPGQGDVVVKPKIMISPPATVSVLDYYTNQSVVANVYCSVSWRPGKWDKFTTYSPQNGTYTNQTVIPDSLTVGAQYSLSANVSIGWYDKATASSTFWIGTGANINPVEQSVSIYYTEAQTFRVDLDAIYYQMSGGGDITNATITLMAAASSNYSTVRWDARWSEDYSQSSSGRYSGWIYVGTFSQSIKAIPEGATYFVSLRLSQGQYYETRYFTFKLTIFPAPSILTQVSGSGQYVFWGAIAQIKLNYYTAWTYGSYSLPTTPILNSTSSPSFAPPFVQVLTDWSGSWTATHLVLDADGVYTLYVDTASFATPTDDGNGAGETSFNVRLNKTHYSLSNPVALTLHIKRLTTSVTGAVEQAGGTLSLTNTTSTISRDAKTIFVWYNDTHTGAKVGVAGATLGYTFRSSLGTFLGSGTLTPHPTRDGLYNMTLPGTLTNQTPGTYYLYVDASKGNYYVVRQLTVTLNILRIPSTIGTYTLGENGTHIVGTELTVMKDTTFTIYLWFNDTHHGVPIPGAQSQLTYSSARFGSGQVTPVTGVPGLYSVSFQAYDAGDWSITFSADVPLYEQQEVIFTVVVQTPASFNIYQVIFVGFGGAGIVLVGAVGWLLLRRARVPFIIKKIDESLKLISKGDHEAATPVALRSREEIVVGITEERIDVFGRRPIGPEAGEGAAETGGIAPTPETSALKKELEAVEPKQKSGEVIEEVEMDTLDEELQKLEKFEDKEKLPDGAKEVRDVVEKYKQSKKKKE